MVIYLLRTMPRKMCIAVVTLLPLELAAALERYTEETGVTKSALIRRLLREHLKPYLEPQPSRSGPVGPGGSALRGAGFAGPELGWDVTQPPIEEKAGGESG
jgi:hypothetical protein